MCEWCRIFGTSLTSSQWILLVLLWIFFFSYVGSEVSYGVYLATFVVESKIQLTKKIGAEITAIFFGCFAIMRFLSIFAGTLLPMSSPNCKQTADYESWSSLLHFKKM